MSATLLAQRLRKLEQIGVVERVHGASANEYRLTAAGEELRPIVMALGHWGARWIGSRLQPGQLDAGFLMWDVRRFVQLERISARAPYRDSVQFLRCAAARASVVARRRRWQRRPVP